MPSINFHSNIIKIIIIDGKKVYLKMHPGYMKLTISISDIPTFTLLVIALTDNCF